MHRRTLLASIGSAAVGLQAGCLAGDTEPPTEADGEPVVVDRAVETTGTDCMTGDEDDRVSATFRADGVTLDGVAPAPTPCHEATIASAAVESGVLRVRIAVAPTDDVCVECVGAIAYTATIELEGADGLDAVTVVHGDTGGTHTIDRGESSPARDRRRGRARPAGR